jgi:hypothetical protein
MLRRKRSLPTKTLVLGILFALTLACARDPKREAEDAYREFEQALAGGEAEQCLRAKERCLAAIGEAVRDGESQVRALRAKITSGANRDPLADATVWTAIEEVEKELADLSLKQEEVKSAECERFGL